MPGPTPSYVRYRRLQLIGRNCMESGEMVDLDSRARDADASKLGPSKSRFKYNAQLRKNKTVVEHEAGVDQATEHDERDTVTAFMASEETNKYVVQLAPPNGEESSAAPENVEQHDPSLSPTQTTDRDVEQSRRGDLPSALQLSRTSLHLDPLEKALSPRVYILGSNAVGKFIAHALAGAPEAPPVTLLIHHHSLLKRWYQEGSSIKLLKDRQLEEKRGIKVELMDHFYPKYSWGVPQSKKQSVSHELEDTVIDNLIVTTQGYTTISALTAIRHRLRPSSTICFMHKSVPIINYVNSSVFPDATQRPNYILGSLTHTIYSMQDKYSIIQQKAGRVALTAIPREMPKPQLREGEVSIRRIDISRSLSSKYLMRTFHSAPDLYAKALHTGAFYANELEKLAITSIHGPVSVVYDCFSDQLLYNREAAKSIKALAIEISLVLRSLPELSEVSSVDDIFSSKRLERLVLSATEKSGKNRSTMLMEVTQGKETNIDFYSGYLLRRAKELGIDCPRLEMITSMVKGKQGMRRSGMASYIPFKI